MVIITGGSWAVGEWQFHRLAGPGIAHYFSCGDHPVINLAKSSISNREQIQLIETLLTRFTPMPGDRFFWLVHSPLVGVPTEEIYLNATSLKESIKNLLNVQLEYADKLAGQYNININLVGASCDLNDIPAYRNLSVIVPSWGQLLDPTYPASIFGHQTDHMTELRDAIKKDRPDLLEEYNQIGGCAFAKRRSMLKQRTMYDSFHPTSLAHKQLSTYLIKEVL